MRFGRDAETDAEPVRGEMVQRPRRKLSNDPGVRVTYRLFKMAENLTNNVTV